MQRKNILVIDSSPASTDFLQHYLLKTKYLLTICHNEQDGLNAALDKDFDIIITEINFSSMHGFDLIKTIRAQKKTPIIVLTNRQDTIDQVLSFEHGADDYIKKPCALEELLVRINAVLSRSQPQSVEEQASYVYGDLVLDAKSHTVILQDKLLEITNTEFSILKILIQNPGQAYSKEELTQLVLHRQYAHFDRSIDVHVSNLRQKLGNNKVGLSRIKTIRGFGYTLQ